MKKLTDETVESLLLQHIPRDFLMGVQDGLGIGAMRGFSAGGNMHMGHRANAVGQMRHLHMTETFWDSLAAAGADPTPIRGNQIVTGQLGIFKVGRFNVANRTWNNGRRSLARRQLALANRAMEQLVMPDLFESRKPIGTGTVFMVTVFDRSIQDSMATPFSVDIAVPDHNMTGWLYRETVDEFLKLYETVAETQIDSAVPTLKAGVRKDQRQQNEK